jgi:molybdopterin-guanine dinucleotide biosynthesis protein
MIEHREQEPVLEELVARLPAGIDLVITEGFKRAATPKFEIVRSAIGGARIAPQAQLLALVIDDHALAGEAVSLGLVGIQRGRLPCWPRQG